MSSGQDRAIPIMQHFGGHRAEEESSESAIAVGGHHDQLNLFGLCRGDDLCLGLSFDHQATHRQIRQFLLAEGVQLLCLLTQEPFGYGE